MVWARSLATLHPKTARRNATFSRNDRRVRRTAGAERFSLCTGILANQPQGLRQDSLGKPLATIATHWQVELSQIGAWMLCIGKNSIFELLENGAPRDSIGSVYSQSRRPNRGFKKNGRRIPTFATQKVQWFYRIRKQRRDASKANREFDRSILSAPDRIQICFLLRKSPPIQESNSCYTAAVETVLRCPPVSAHQYRIPTFRWVGKQ